MFKPESKFTGPPPVSITFSFRFSPTLHSIELSENACLQQSELTCISPRCIKGKQSSAKVWMERKKLQQSCSGRESMKQALSAEALAGDSPHARYALVPA